MEDPSIVLIKQCMDSIDIYRYIFHIVCLDMLPTFFTMVLFCQEFEHPDLFWSLSSCMKPLMSIAQTEKTMETWPISDVETWYYLDIILILSWYYLDIILIYLDFTHQKWWHVEMESTTYTSGGGRCAQLLQARQFKTKPPGMCQDSWGSFCTTFDKFFNVHCVTFQELYWQTRIWQLKWFLQHTSII